MKMPKIIQISSPRTTPTRLNALNDLTTLKCFRISAVVKAVLAILFLAIASVSSAQTKALQTARISTPNVLCDLDKQRLTTYLDRYDGIQSLVFNLRKGEITVKYLTDRTDIEQIKTAIANAGYDADDVEAEPSAYQRLPKTCKKASDGGGHPAPKPKPATEAPPAEGSR